jgi:putative copper export protein
MRKAVLFALMLGLGLIVFYWAEPQPASDILSSVNSTAAAVVSWFDD